MSSIPTLDLTSDRHEAAKLLITALEDPGFLYIQNVKGYEPGIKSDVAGHTPSGEGVATPDRYHYVITAQIISVSYYKQMNCFQT